MIQCSIISMILCSSLNVTAYLPVLLSSQVCLPPAFSHVLSISTGLAALALICAAATMKSLGRIAASLSSLQSSGRNSASLVWAGGRTCGSMNGRPNVQLQLVVQHICSNRLAPWRPWTHQGTIVLAVAVVQHRRTGRLQHTHTLPLSSTCPLRTQNSNPT